MQAEAPLDSSRLPLRRRIGILLRLQRYALPFWDKILLRACSTFLLSLLSTVPALLAPYVIDDALPNGDFALLLRLSGIGILTAVVIRYRLRRRRRW